MRDGTYWGVIVGSASGKSSKKNTPQITIDWSVTHVRNDASGEYEPIEPKTAQVVLYMVDSCKDSTTRALEELKFDGNFSEPKYDEKFYGDGHELYLKNEEYNGKPQERWNIGGIFGGSIPLQSEEVLQMNARWKAWSAKPTSAPKGKPGATAPGATTPPAAPTKPEDSVF